MKTQTVKSLSDSRLIQRTEYLVRRERTLVECLLTHFQEIQDRKLYIQMGYTSLLECMVKHFKQSETVAYGRIAALKVVQAVPEIIESLNSGELNVTHLTLAQSYFRTQEKKTQTQMTHEEKSELLTCLKNTTTKEAKQVLAEKDPTLELPYDQVRPLNQDHVQLQFVINKAVLEKIERLKTLISHQNVDPSLGEILELALTTTIETLEKKKGIYAKKDEALNLTNKEQERAAKTKQDNPVKPEKACFPKPKLTPAKGPSGLQGKTLTQSFSDRNSRYISRRVKQAVLRRAHNQCEYVHKNGERCSSKFQMQFDHIKAFSRGGGSGLANIQLLCRVHNAYKSNYGS